MQTVIFDQLLLKPSTTSAARSAIPAFLYGCAWKKDQTADLVYQAITTGFRGIDVAGQPKHYREELAGNGIRRAIKEGICRRGDLFIQTKFTSLGGQDPTSMPYDPSSSIPTQVETSLASSLRNLRHTPNNQAENNTHHSYIDSFLLHSPLSSHAETMQAWHTLESHVPRQIRNLGISNISLPLLEALYAAATIKPSVVQNRFYGDSGYDVALRRFCRDKGIVYQSFWTLTANPHVLRHGSVEEVATGATVDRAVALYALVMGLEGVVICNGTKSHMSGDVEGLRLVKLWAEKEPEAWKSHLDVFRKVIGEDAV